MKKLVPVVLFLVVAALHAGEALKEAEKNASADKVFSLDEVVVTGTKAEKYLRDEPGSVELVTHDKVKASSNAGEAAASVSGVDVGQNGALGQTQNMLIRGVASEGTLILLDGIPLNGSYSGLVDFSSLALDNIDRIEIMKGPASSLYGANAVGGVVNLITKSRAGKPELTLAEKYGTFNTHDLDLGISGKLDLLSINLGGSYKHTDGARPNSAFDAYNANGKIACEFIKGSTLALTGGYYNDKVGAPGPAAAASLTDRQEDLRYFGNFETSLALTDDMNFKVNLYAGSTSQNFFSASTTTSTEVNYDLNAQYSYDLAGLNVLTVGAKYRNNKLTQNLIGQKESTTKSVFAQDVLDMLGNFIFTPSIRLDSDSGYGDTWNPQASLVYNLDDGLQLKGSVGTSFRAPNFSELYWPLDSWGDVGNPALKPEKATSYDFGVSYEAPGTLFARATYFQNNISDMIQWSLDPSTFFFTPLNVGKAVTYGVETEIKLRPAAFAEFSLNYTWLSAKDTGSGKDLYYRPKNKVNAGLKLKPSIFTIDLNTEYYDIRTGNDALTYVDVNLPAVIVSSARIAARVAEESELYAGVSNLEDARYELRSGYPMPGRTYYCGVNYKF